MALGARRGLARGLEGEDSTCVVQETVEHANGRVFLFVPLQVGHWLRESGLRVGPVSLLEYFLEVPLLSLRLKSG